MGHETAPVRPARAIHTVGVEQCRRSEPASTRVRGELTGKLSCELMSELRRELVSEPMRQLPCSAVAATKSQSEEGRWRGSERAVSGDELSRTEVRLPLRARASGPAAGGETAELSKERRVRMS